LPPRSKSWLTPTLLSIRRESGPESAVPGPIRRDGDVRFGAARRELRDPKLAIALEHERQRLIENESPRIHRDRRRRVQLAG
jgi:hypothetical protein